MAKQAKDYRPAFFGAVPNRAIVDSRLTGTAFRLLTLYAFHDRLSIVERKGDGCTASNKTLCGRLGCDYTTLIKLRRSLQEWGYILLYERRGGRRLERVKVVPDHLADPKSWPFDQCYIGFTALRTWGVEPEKVDEIANLWTEKNGDLANYVSEKVGEEISETPENLLKTDTQYIPPRGEIYSSEEGEYTPRKGRDRENRAASESASDLAPPASLRPHLPASFDLADCGAQVAMLERAFGRIGRNAGAIPTPERIEWVAFLENVFEAKIETDEPTARRADRLSGEMAA